MPPTTPLDPEPTDKQTNPQGGSDSGQDAARQQGEVVQTPASQPVTFIPHAPDGSVPSRPVVLRGTRFGDLEEHELLHLLDSIEDERARARFRESIYISLFVWVIILWVLLYGPKYLWHAPKLISPEQALKQHELTILNAPRLPHPAPKLPQKSLDNKTIAKLRAMNPKPVPAPPAAEAPKPVTPPTPTPVTPPPAAMPAPVTPPPVPARTPPPIVAEAPTPHPSTTPNFSTPSTSDSMRNLADSVARDRNAGGGISGRRTGGGGSPLSMGGAEVLSPPQPGVDLGPYLRKILADIYRNWYPLIPEEAKPPLSKQGEAYIRFTIAPDGTIAAMHLDGSTHDDAINKSCWGSITSEGQFPQLPKNWHGPLELRLHYLVNKEPQ